MTNLLVEAQRAESLTEDCDYCGEEIGRPCVNPKTGQPLEHQAAHRIRMQKAGVVNA